MAQEAGYGSDPSLDMPVQAEVAPISGHGENAAGLKKTIFRYLQPAVVVAYVLFWWLGPKSMTHNALTPVILGPSLALMIFSLEFVNERYASWRITEHEFLRDFFYVVLSYSLMGFLGSKLIEDPLKAVKVNLGITTPWFTELPFLVQAFTVFFLIEFVQYWIHRAMHNTHIVWSVHGPHHYLTQLNAFKSGVGHPIELLLLQISVVVFLDVPVNALFCGAGLVSVVAKFAHSNVRFDPPRWYSYIFVTIEAHSLHHSTDYDATRSNYANAFLIIDRACGTFMDGDSETIGMPGRVPQSIWEQMIFPYTYLKQVYGRPKSTGA